MVLGAKEGQGGRCMVLVLEGGMMHGGDGGGAEVRARISTLECVHTMSI